jgi:hypothetical protein
MRFSAMAVRGITHIYNVYNVQEVQKGGGARLLG